MDQNEKIGQSFGSQNDKLPLKRTILGRIIEFTIYAGFVLSIFWIAQKLELLLYLSIFSTIAIAIFLATSFISSRGSGTFAGRKANSPGQSNWQNAEHSNDQHNEAGNSSGNDGKSDEISDGERKNSEREQGYQSKSRKYHSEKGRTTKQKVLYGSEVMWALDVIGLDGEARKEDISAKCKALMKLYHPDLNGGNRMFESLLGKTLEATKILKKEGLA